MAELDVGMGGRAAEELFFGNDQITTGCGGDLSSTSNNSIQMALIWGFGGKLSSYESFENMSDESRKEAEDSARNLSKVRSLGKLL